MLNRNDKKVRFGDGEAPVIGRAAAKTHPMTAAEGRWPGANSTLTVPPPTVIVAGAKLVLVPSGAVALSRDQTGWNQLNAWIQSWSPPSNPEVAVERTRLNAAKTRNFILLRQAGQSRGPNIEINRGGADRPRVLKL